MIVLGIGSGGKGAPVAYPGFQREGCLRSGPIHKVCVWGGGGGGGFRSDIRKVGGPFRVRSDTFGHTENIYMYLPKVGTRRYFLVETTYVTQAENLTYIGCIA